MVKIALKDIQENLDLNKKYPDYFNKWVFKIGILAILLVVIVAGNDLDWDFSKKVYVSCPEYKSLPCQNPLYPCTEDSIDPNTCNVEQLNAGESLGTKPTQLVKNFSSIVFIILLLTFILNHVMAVNKEW